MEEIETPATQPSVEVEFIREQIWITVSVLIVKLCFVFIIYLPALKTVWAVSVGFLALALFVYGEPKTPHRESVIGLVVLDSWFIYGLLPWNDWISYWIILLVQLITCGLSIAYYFMAKREFLVLQCALLLVPTVRSAQLEAMEMNVIVVFFVLGWYLTIGINYMLAMKQIDLLVVLMVTLPLLRLGQGLLVTYFAVLCIGNTLRVYVAPPQPTQPTETSEPNLATSLLITEDQLEPQQPQQPQPPQPPQPPQQPIYQSRFRVAPVEPLVPIKKTNHQAPPQVLIVAPVKKKNNFISLYGKSSDTL